MARGWESKAVEAQQEEVTRRRPNGPAASRDQLMRDDRRRALELTRKRTVDDLSRATAPAHRKMLEHAIASLDRQLDALK